MTVVAKAVKGHEWMYCATSAHMVSERNAKKICKILNELKYLIDEEKEVWHPFEVDKYDTATIYAEEQKFVLSRNGQLKRRFTYFN